MNGSIRHRLLLTSFILLSAFLGLTGIALNAAFEKNAETALRERLQSNIYTLLAAAKEDELGRMRIPKILSDPSLNQPESGFYAEVQGENNEYRWRSNSLLGTDIVLFAPTAPGRTVFQQSDSLSSIHQGIIWEDSNMAPLEYVLSIGVDRTAIEKQEDQFQQTLTQWLGGLGLLLLLSQMALIRWGLKPLQNIAKGIHAIEQGKQDQVTGSVPKELSHLVEAINSLIRHGKSQQEHMRNSLADLAHSLKTPLAILRGSQSDTNVEQIHQLIDEQTNNIDQSISYQRQKAAITGNSRLNQSITFRPIIERICQGLQKIHHDKAISCQQAIGEELNYRADQGDMYELFGNLLDNAFKHCNQQIKVHAQTNLTSLIIIIEDDGEGIDEHDRKRILKRGERADQKNPGQGIGLAVVNEIMLQYLGEIKINQSAMGGTSIHLHFPLNNKDVVN